MRPVGLAALLLVQVYFCVTSAEDQYSHVASRERRGLKLMRLGRRFVPPLEGSDSEVLLPASLEMQLRALLASHGLELPEDASAEQLLEAARRDLDLEEFPVDEEMYIPEETPEKRGLALIRMGKRSMSLIRMGKRGMPLIRMGKRPLEEEKRGMGLIRMGGKKRGMSLVRMGKRSPGEEWQQAVDPSQR